MINLEFRIKCFPFYTVKTSTGYWQLMLGSKTDVFLWRVANIAYILFKIIVEYCKGIYFEIYDENLKLTDRLQYYFLISCESLAFAFMLCTGLFSTNIRDTIEECHRFEYKMSKCYCY